MSEIMRQIWTPQMQMLSTIIVLLIVCLYALSIVWISRDARLRGETPLKWMIVGLVPGAGIIAYLLLRPPMLAMDRDEQELEVALKQRELMRYGECVKCGYPVKDDYVLCPNCQTKLRNLCSGCSKPLEPSWSVCPYCTTPVAGSKPVSSEATVTKPKRRRATSASSSTRSRGAVRSTSHDATNKSASTETKPATKTSRPTQRRTSSTRAQSKETNEATSASSESAKTTSAK